MAGEPIDSYLSNSSANGSKFKESYSFPVAYHKAPHLLHTQESECKRKQKGRKEKEIPSETEFKEGAR